MKYTIEFELPDNETVKKQIKYCPVHWQIWGYCGDTIAKLKVEDTADIPQMDCDTCRHYKLTCELFSEICKYEPIIQTETQNSNMTFETPQIKRIKTTDYCDICNHKGCDNCIANSLDDYCVPSSYAPKNIPQIDLEVTRNSLRTDCTECRFVGWYDTDFPCVNCVRKNKDYYDSE